ncbi:MAG TPA: glycine/sarcosine/betaine reductase complex component C subunit beta [Solirubrobacteraceae bacterium]|jgi:betaine reductase|nr:glycine/sarcosine/betaine reductase complex component C subunit beta [Solirubrobacteraceae bacterium]
MSGPVISAASAILAHTPSLAREGSKPSRELARDPGLQEAFLGSLRTYEQALAYPPHRAFVGEIHPRDLPERPWTAAAPNGSARFTAAGEIMPEEEFLALLASVDEFGLVTLEPALAERASAALARHPLGERFALERIASAAGDVEAALNEEGALALPLAGTRIGGAIRRAHDADEALAAPVLLENLASKASATLALLHLLEGGGVDPGSIDYVIGCGEEAIGDRYQRGGGNLAKAVAAAGGLANASGADIKNFCAAPIPALVIGASLVSSGVFSRVAVVAGGSLPKLGMKFQGHLKNGLPVLEDVLGGIAALIEADDGISPTLRLDAVGRHRVAAGGSAQQIMEALTVQPLREVGLQMLDVDDYATELHNPEVTEPQGSGDVPARNYRLIAALAVRAGEIGREDVPTFVAERGMPGFAPTQGHIASSLCYLPHALGGLRKGDTKRVQMIAKGSLFLGRMSEMSDGMSLLLERNQARER